MREQPIPHFEHRVPCGAKCSGTHFVYRFKNGRVKREQCIELLPGYTGPRRRYKKWWGLKKKKST